MITQDELDDAVTAGVLNRDTAQTLREFVANRRSSPVADEERFRLVASFNDVFVVVACALLLFATASIIGTQVSPLIAGLASALVSWGLAEVFVRRRRMALPAIVLSCCYVGAIYLAGFKSEWSWLALVMAAVAVPATWLHWKRFRVPITIAALGVLLVLTAAGAAALADTASFIAAFGNEPGGKTNWSNPAWRTWQEGRRDWFPMYRHAIVFIGGLILFALAMRWNITDVARRSHRADTGFWLHVAAAPCLVHPAFSLITRGAGPATEAQAAMVLVLYLLLALLSLVIDRRALLVSALGYVLYALRDAYGNPHEGSEAFAVIALIVGLGLAVLSIFWSSARAVVLRWAPNSVRRLTPPSTSTFTSTH